MQPQTAGCMIILKTQNFWFCGLFGFFRKENKKFLSLILAFSCPLFEMFFDLVIKKFAKYIWNVKDKQFACWQVLIKSD